MPANIPAKLMYFARKSIADATKVLIVPQ